MKIGNSHYTVEEFSLVIILLVFFIMIFVGSFNYRPAARFFPFLLSIPGSILLLLYLFRGYLPDSVSNLMMGVGEFGIGSPAVQNDNHVDNQEKYKEFKSSNARSYLIFAFTISYILFSYLFGFYFSTLTHLCIYFYITRRIRIYQLITNIFLIAVLISLVYVFDLAFGYHFNEGILLTFP